MIQELLPDVIFTATDGTETVLDPWTCAENMGYPYYEAAMGDLKFCLQAHRDGQWYLKVSNMGTAAITGFAGIRFPWKHQEGGFTLIPGIYYDGNYWEYQ